MGNICSKRKLKHSKAFTLKFQLDDVLENDREFKACQESVDFIQIGEVKDANNLELYLNDVFEKKCVFKAEQEEVEFIQTGIETLVQKIVDLVLEGFFPKIKWFEDNLKCSSNTHFSRGETLENDLTELYFTIKTRDRYVKVRSTRCPIIKVGSFYEGTKNRFPDEFDFIFLLYSDAPPNLEIYIGNKDEHNVFFFWAHGCIKETLTACNKESLKYVCPHGRLHRDRELYFDRYVDQHGPASMLRFIYNNGSMEKRYIYVDLVPAYKVYFGQTFGLAKYDLLSCLINKVKPNSFREELLSDKQFLWVGSSVSFTETEVRFMKNVLSQKHVKVYRILKFLINGHGDGETLHTYRWVFGLGNGKITGYSSYQIKIMMIHHHDECTNTNTEHIGPCVIQVLEAICQYDKTETFPNLHKLNDKFYRFCLLPVLDVLTRKLRLLQISEDIYDYENVRMKSVTRQYLNILNRAVPDMAEYLASLGDVGPGYYDWLHYLEMSKCRKCLKTCW